MNANIFSIHLFVSNFCRIEAKGIRININIFKVLNSQDDILFFKSILFPRVMVLY